LFMTTKNVYVLEHVILIYFMDRNSDLKF
jgi:hypothetical protein